MDDFVTKQPVALTIIFSYLLSSSNGQNQILCRYPEVVNFILLNRAISDSFDINETFWLWYINHAFNCKICIKDGLRLKASVENMAQPIADRWCFWKKECKVQVAARRLRRQWSVKFASRVLTHRNVPIVWDKEPNMMIVPPSQMTMMTPSYPGKQKKAEINSEVSASVFFEVSPLGIICYRIRFISFFWQSFFQIYQQYNPSFTRTRIWSLIINTKYLCRIFLRKNV